MSPEELWASKYAARFAEEKAAEEARREQAFLDLPALVCGEELRMMTPMDLLVLNGVRSPFVCPGEVSPGDVALFLWYMNVSNDGGHGWRNERRKKQMFRRIAVRPFDAAVKSIFEHVEDIFQDAPGVSGGERDERRPLGTCFLVPLTLGIAKATHWGRDEILRTPLPQLFQFMKALRADAQGNDFVDTAPSDRIRSDFLSELNELSNARN